MAILNPPRTTSVEQAGGTDSRAAGLAAGRARRRAWTVIWCAFVVWLALVAAGASRVDAFIRTAVSPRPAVALTARGIPLYVSPQASQGEARLKEGTRLEEGSRVEAPTGSEVVLELFDGSTVRLLPGAELELTSHQEGKFNRELTGIHLSLLGGPAVFSVAGGLPDGRSLVVQTRHGRLSLDEGEYLVWAQEGETRASAYAGQALVEQENGVTLQMRARQRVELPAKDTARQPRELVENLVGNGTFRELDLDGQLPASRAQAPRLVEVPMICDKEDDLDAGALKGWCVFNRGERGRPDAGGRVWVHDPGLSSVSGNVIQITRTTDKNFHMKTGLEQKIDRDVYPYRKVELSAWIKVNFAELRGGGFMGSEYPLMLGVEYIAENGGRPTWERGFFYGDPEGNPVDSPVQGQQVRQGIWERFTFDLRSLGEPPARITRVVISSSGWDFDAEVADVELSVE